MGSGPLFSQTSGSPTAGADWEVHAPASGETSHQLLMSSRLEAARTPGPQRPRGGTGVPRAGNTPHQAWQQGSVHVLAAKHPLSLGLIRTCSSGHPP